MENIENSVGVYIMKNGATWFGKNVIKKMPKDN